MNARVIANAVAVHIETTNQKKDFLIEVESEKALHLTADDYNFDKLTDFSVWHMDEGQGTYTVHRVFVYQPEKSDFIEIYPACSDEFINLKIDKLKKRLISTYFLNNYPMRCFSKPNRFHPHSALWVPAITQFAESQSAQNFFN